MFGIVVLRPYGTRFMDQPWRSQGGDSLSLGESRKGAQIPDLTGKEENGQPADGSCSLGTACSQPFQDREFTLREANCDDTNLMYHQAQFKGERLGSYSFCEALSASRIIQDGWTPSDRPKDLCVTTDSHEQLEANKDNIQGVFFCPQLLQQHLFVSVPAGKVSPRFQCPDMEAWAPSGPSKAIPSLALAPSSLPPVLTGGLTGNLLTPQAFTQSRLNLELLFMEMKANIVSPLPLEIRGPLRTSEVTASTRCHLFIGTCNLSVPIILRDLICFSKP